MSKQKHTPKQIAVTILLRDAGIIFDYYYERDHDEYDNASESMQEKIRIQLDKFDKRFRKMLEKARGE